MTQLNVTLSDEATKRLAERAKESGFSHVEDYARALLETEAARDDDDEYDEELERLLLERLDGPSIELTPNFFDQMKAQIAARRAAESRGAK